jgi:cytochrome o ubiquinol oxidase subunit 1
VEDIDAFTDMKEKGLAYKQPTSYHDIHMPKNTAAGFINGIFAFLFGFGMVWCIWWLAIAAFLGMLITVAVRAANEDISYVVSAAEVERIETLRYRLAASAAQHGATTGPAASGPITQA